MNNSKLYLLTSGACPHCKATKEKLKEELNNGTIKEVNILSDKGKIIAKKLDIKGIPTLIKCENKDKCEIMW